MSSVSLYIFYQSQQQQKVQSSYRDRVFTPAVCIGNEVLLVMSLYLRSMALQYMLHSV